MQLYTEINAISKSRFKSQHKLLIFSYMTLGKIDTNWSPSYSNYGLR